MPSKKQVVASIPDVRDGAEFGDRDRDLALYLSVDLSASPDVRTERAVLAYNVATRHLVEAGILLASVKAEMTHDAFLALIEDRGIANQRAYELMQGARFVAQLPEGQREQVLALGKSKVLALASADATAVQAMLEEGDLNLDLISVKHLRTKLRELEANNADLAVQRDTAKAELAGARKLLAKPRGEREDGLPNVVADLRAEMVALAKKAELCISSFHGLGTDLGTLNGSKEAQAWVDPTVRLAVSALGAVRLQLDGVMKAYLSVLEGEDPTPTERTYLSRQEVLEAAQAFPQLVSMHTWEKDLREWEAEQARPREKGRPRAKPEAPTK